MCRTVVDEAKWASQEFEDIRIDLEGDERDGRIRIVDVELAVANAFYNRFDLSYQAILHDGEKETLAFLCDSAGEWLVCAADKAVFRILGAIGKSERGVSLEKVLSEVGLSRQLDWPYSEEFRLRYTRLGQADSVRDQGLL